MAIKQVPSPNYTRGRSRKVSKIIIHWIVGNLSAADAVFRNPASQVSAHYGIENSKIHQYVKESDTAWHAMSANPFSIGIENSAAPGRPATTTTYKTLAKLCADICKRYKLNPDKAIEPHNKYVSTQCPGTMDLARIKRETKQLMKGEEMVDKTTANVMYRLYLGTGVSSWGKKNAIGKMTPAQLQKHLISSDDYKKLVAEAKKGRLSLTVYPKAIRKALKVK